MSKAFIVLLFAIACLMPVAGLAAEASVASFDMRKAFFAEEEVVFSYRVADGTSVDWSLVAGRRMMGRGQLTAEGGRADLKLVLPPVAEDATVELMLTVGDHSRKLLLYPADAFALRKTWLEKLDITLFDPEGDTADCFDETGIPYDYTKNTATLDDLQDGLLVIGEGTEFDLHHGLGQALLDAASRGVVVLVLCPGNCDLPLGPPRPARMQYEGDAAIRKLVPALASDLNIAARFAPRADYDRVVLGCTDQTDGWPWARMDFVKKGRLLVCGVEIIEAWDDSPAPRYFLRDALEELIK